MRSALIGALVLTVGCATTARHADTLSTARPERPDPASLVTQTFVGFFRNCASGDHDLAKKALATMRDDLPDEYVVSRLTKIGRIGPVDPERVHMVHVVADKAVLAYRESEKDLDPLYFVREGSDWRILLTLTRFDTPYFTFTPRDLSELKTLEAWFRDMKARELYGKR